MLKTNLAYIHANSNFLLQSITRLKNTKNLFSKTITEIKDIQEKLKENQWLEIRYNIKKSTHVSQRMNALKSCAKFHVDQRRKDPINYEDLKDLRANLNHSSSD